MKHGARVIATTVLALCLAGAAAAALYKSVDENGNVVYTDVPPSKEAEPVQLPEINVIESVPANPYSSSPSASPAAAPAAPALRYSLSIAQPADEQTLQNTREIPVSVELQPPLRPGHRLAVMLNGEMRVVGTATELTVTNVDRGAWRLTAAVIDAAGKPVTTSQPVTVHVKQRSILHNN